ncbi:MAG: hypothetical protein ACYCXN_16050, partial [Acidimicrobiales bacterium]
MISVRRVSLGGGYRYLISSVAAGDGAAGRSNSLSRYYATSGTPPGVFLGAGLSGRDSGRGGAPGLRSHRGAPGEHARCLRRPGERRACQGCAESAARWPAG